MQDQKKEEGENRGVRGVRGPKEELVSIVHSWSGSALGVTKSSDLRAPAEESLRKKRSAKRGSKRSRCR